MVLVVHLHAAHRDRLDRPYVRHVATSDPHGRGGSFLLVQDALALEAKDVVGRGEVQDEAGGRVLRAARNPLGRTTAAIAQAHHQLVHIISEPLVGDGELTRAHSLHHSPVRVHQTREQLASGCLGGTQVVHRNVLVPQHTEGPQLGLEAAVVSSAVTTHHAPGEGPTAVGARPSRHVSAALGQPDRVRHVAVRLHPQTASLQEHRDLIGLAGDASAGAVSIAQPSTQGVWGNRQVSDGPRQRGGVQHGVIGP